MSYSFIICYSKFLFNSIFIYFIFLERQRSPWEVAEHRLGTSALRQSSSCLRLLPHLSIPSALYLSTRVLEGSSYARRDQSTQPPVGRDGVVVIANRYGLDCPGSNTGRREIFCTRPERLQGPPSLLYNGYRYCLGVKRQGRGVDHPPPTSAEVKERVKLYIYSASGSSQPVLV